MAISAAPQTTDPTAEAKAHYQNAVAAIARNDWQTAETELTQVEKLAPQNALVHYDLAQAYSHTGESALAKAELNKALQLGLPAEQRRAAEELKDRLANTSTKTTVNQNKTPDLLAGLIRRLNAMLLNDVGLVSDEYWPQGFTFEKSTSKLWWSRLIRDNCGVGSLRPGKIAAKVSEIDTGSIRLAKQYEEDGTIIGGDFILFPCKKDVSGTENSCLEVWDDPFCSPTSVNTRKQSPDSVEVMDKTASQRHIDERGNLIRTDTSMSVFSGRIRMLVIETTGDPKSSEEAVLLLQKIVAKAGGQSVNQVSNLEEATRKATEEADREEELAKSALRAKEEAEKAVKVREETAKQIEKTEAARVQLSQIQGRWHARLGHATSAYGKAHAAGTTYGSFNGTVSVREDYDYDLVLNSPNGNLMQGTYSYGNETWQLRRSDLPTFENDCFTVAGNCYTSYSWNKTQVFSVNASVSDDGSIQVKFTHEECNGDCGESSRHLPDRSGSVEMVTPSIIRLTVGGSTYRLTK